MYLLLSTPNKGLLIMASIFTKIVQGEIPAHKVAETAEYLAFLDIYKRR